MAPAYIELRSSMLNSQKYFSVKGSSKKLKMFSKSLAYRRQATHCTAGESRYERRVKNKGEKGA